MKCNKSAVSAALGAVSLCLAVNAFAATVGFRAVIAADTSGCAVIVPESTVNFTPLQARVLTGPVTTYQIKPLQVVMSCSGENLAITPSLTLQGHTPYTMTSNTVFLDGAANGVGFMVRQSDGSTPSQADYYNPQKAISNNGEPVIFSPLDSSNNHYQEKVFWVGLVGPLSSPIVPGPFSATLILNVVFQ